MGCCFMTACLFVLKHSCRPDGRLLAISAKVVLYGDLVYHSGVGASEKSEM